MAKFQKKKIQDTKNSNFGHYSEDTGGGIPFDKGNTNTRTTQENGKLRKANNDTMQPRTDDGKFTYKSVNGQSINPKYGPSRGKTVNPLLTEGENGIYIDDVESQFANKKGKYWDKYKDKWYQGGGEYMLMSQGKHHKADFATRVAGDAIWNVAKRIYNKVTGEFGGIIGEGKESDVFKQGKKGARTAEEQAAYQKAQQTGEEQAVIDKSSGGIKLKPGTVLPVPQPAPQPRTTGQSPIAPSVGGNQPGAQPTLSAGSNVSAIENADYTPKYSDEDLNDVKEFMKQQGFSDDDIAKFDLLSPKEKDDYIDKNFIEDEEEAVAEPEAQEETVEEEKTEEPKEEEDSEAIKKIKNLGFTD